MRAEAGKKNMNVISCYVTDDLIAIDWFIHG